MDANIVDTIPEGEAVILYIHLRGGTHLQEKCTAGCARKTIEAWRKYLRYCLIPETERVNVPAEDRPFYVYHMLDGNPETSKPPLPIKSIFLMQEVMGMQYFNIPPEDKTHAHMIEAQTEMLKELKAFLKSELKSDAWKNPPDGEEHSH